MKIQLTILLFFIFTLFSFSSPISKTNQAEQENMASSTAPSDQLNASGAIDIGSPTENSGDSLNSILLYTVIVFFTILIVILIQNRNLEKRYKKLFLDFTNKDHTKKT